MLGAGNYARLRLKFHRWWLNQSMTQLDSDSLYVVMMGMGAWSGSVDRNLSNIASNTDMVQMVRP